MTEQELTEQIDVAIELAKMCPPGSVQCGQIKRQLIRLYSELRKLDTQEFESLSFVGD